MLEINNEGKAVPISSIPTYGYADFYVAIDDLMQQPSVHCVSYFAMPNSAKFRFFCIVADDKNHKLYILSHVHSRLLDSPLEAITAKHFSFHSFERELHENWGIEFANHPWLKPIRYAASRHDRSKKMETYKFYSIRSEELHEVGVGPIHAGIIEPGYFRFICNGETVLHLEIMHGYQHRGVEQLMLATDSTLRQAIIAESIAGDTAVGHSLSFAMCVESLAEKEVSASLMLERTIALELERIAIHIGDTGALCMDIAYQLGQVACEALRTIMINTTQLWCGSRFGKGLVRPCGTNYPLEPLVLNEIRRNLDDVQHRYSQLADRIFSQPSVLSRFEQVGILTHKQARLLGMVGIAAKASGLVRDVRASHPFQYYKHVALKPIVQQEGDVQARALVRRYEVEQSIQLIKLLLDKYQSLEVQEVAKPNYTNRYKPDSLAVAMVEGWRGEICHVAVTGSQGELIHYKIKDPSQHSWMGVALAMRNQEISDFPICNKSFNLSYCGNDL